MADGRAICPFCATRGDIAKATISGPIITPAGTHTVDFSDPSTFAQAVVDIEMHKKVDGRPAIDHQCPVAGHHMLLYCDLTGGSHEAVAAPAAEAVTA
jgi:hypothetical protein